MADEEKQTDGQPDETDAAESGPGAEQLSLAEIIAQQREQLAAKLDDDALLPDPSKLPGAVAGPDQGDAEPSAAAEEPAEASAADEEPDAEEPDSDSAAEQQPAEAQTEAPAASLDAPVQDEQVTDQPPPEGDQDADASEQPAAPTAETGQSATAKAEAPAKTESSAGNDSAGDDKESDKGSEPEVSEAQLTLAEIIAQQRAELDAKAQGGGGSSGPGASDSGAAAKTVAAADESPEATRPVAAAKPTEAPRAKTRAPGPKKKSARSSGKGRKGGKASSGGAPTRTRPTLMMVLFLGMNTILIGAVAVAVWRFLPSATRTGASTRIDNAGDTSSGVVTSAGAATAVPLSDKMGGQARVEAEIAFKFGKYRTAARRYEQLMNRAALRPADALARDLFAVRYARSLIELDQGTDARAALGRTTRSESPILRAYACQMLAFLDFKDGTYMSARRYGYTAIGVLGAMRETHSLVDDCEYLIARAMSAKVVAIGGEKMDVASNDLLCADPMVGLNEVELYRLLGNGVDSLVKAGLNPSVVRQRAGGGSQRWVAHWSGPSVGQFLRQLSGSGGLDIRWGSGDPALRQRGITVVLADGVTEQRLSEVACGMAGLMARFTGSEIIVMNPRNAESTKIEKELLGREAISMWRRFILKNSAGRRDDKRIAIGQYALARVYESKGEVADALREYGLVARQHEGSQIAPSALLRGAMLRMELLDFDGARRDLLVLQDRYPDSGLFGPAYLNQGIVIRKKAAIDKKGRSKLLAEAVKVFRRLYNLNVSRDTRKAACLELARCLNEQGDYAEAAEWAIRYRGYVDSGDAAGMCESYFMEARTFAAAGKPEAAAKAFCQVLGSNPSAEMRVDVLMRIVPVQIARGSYVQTIGALNALGREKLTAEQHVRYLVLLSESYRAMGLATKAFSILQGQIDGIRDLRMKDTVNLELARCQIEVGGHGMVSARVRYNTARKLLEKIITEMRRRGDDGKRIQNIQVELAEVLLKLDRTTAAIAAAKVIVDMDPEHCPDELRRRAGRILGEAYVREGQYDLAVSVLIDVAAKAKGGKSDG